jgi:hypothetical protein
MQNKNKKILQLDDEKTSQAYPDLKDFKESQSGPQPLYMEKKKTVIRYRTVFFFFGILFVAFGIFIFSKYPIWIMSGIKPIICLITFLLGIASFTVALALRYEREAVRALTHKAEDKLFKAYVERKGQIDGNSHLPFLELMKHKFALRNPYLAAKAKIKTQEYETIHLMDRIVKAPIDLESKEKLFNQALLELDDKFSRILLEYRSKA